LSKTDACHRGPFEASCDRSGPANGLPSATTVVESQTGPLMRRKRENAAGGRPKRTSAMAMSPIPSRIARARRRMPGVPPATRARPGPVVLSETTGAPKDAAAV
jgi:hypothetical protein